MSGYTIVTRDDAPDVMTAYPGFGEMRFFTQPLDAEQVAFTWRLMPPGTGGKGSYGHRHKTQEEIHFVVRGTLQFKIGDEVIEAGPHTAIRIAPDTFRSVHNDGPEEAEMIICSVKLETSGTPDQAEEETEMTPDFWPDDTGDED
jgi:mannose-6-phosphate isomerase-like protein (cupin superfamily)